MTKYQGGYIGNTPGWANQNRSGVWNVAEQVSLKAKNQWPFEDGTIALRYILRNFSAVEGTSYDSGTITVQKDPDVIFWAISNSAQTFGNGTVGFSQVSGGGFGVGDDGDKNLGSYGEEPRGAVYLSWRRPLIIQVSTTNGTGGITSINIQQLGKGLKAVNVNTVKTLETQSQGTAATFNLNRDASNLTTATVVSSGTGYSVGDILTWQETLGDGSGNTMDPYWDLLLHGIAGAGGIIRGNAFSDSGVTGGGQQPRYVGVAAGGPAASGLITPSSGGKGQDNTGDYQSGGGGGGAGWGAGQGGAGGEANLGYVGQAGYSPLNTTYVTNGAPSSINYGSRAIELLVNGVQVKLIANAIDSIALADF